MQIEASAVMSPGGMRRAAGLRPMFAVIFLVCAAAPAAGQALDRIKETGRITFGYVPDVRPFTYRNDAGDPEGYSVELCNHIAAQVEKRLGLPSLTVEWVPLAADARVSDVREGGVDVMCAPVVPSLARRREVSFSIPVFPGGNRAVIRGDSSASLRQALEGTPSTAPVWRGSPAATVLSRTVFAVVAGTTSESWLEERRAMFQVDAEIITVQDHHSGLQQLLDHRVDVFFGDRAVILGEMSEEAHKRLVVLDRLFTHESYAFPVARDDDDFRLLVDAALSELYASDGFGELYARWFGEFPDRTRSFFLWNTFPEHTSKMTPGLASSNRYPDPDLSFAQSIRPDQE